MAANFHKALKAAKQFAEAVQESGVRLNAAYLYGSYAKGYANENSDIDVALVSPDFTGWVDDLDKIRSAILSKDSRIETVRFRPDTFVDENPLAWEVKTTGIPLIGEGKRRLAKRKPHRRQVRA